MARSGVTYEQVVEAATAIEAEGEHPSIQRVRQRLGSGSPNTIHKYLRQWKEAGSAQKPVTLKLPERLQDALLAEINRQASEAGAEAEQEAKDAMATADELASEGERMEAEMAELREQLAELQKARIEDQVKLQARDEDIERLRGELKEERRQAQELRSQINEDEHKYLAVCDQVAGLKQQLAEATSALSQIREELKDSLHRSSYLEAQRDSLKDKAGDLEESLAEYRHESINLRKDYREALDRNNTLLAEVSSLRIDEAKREAMTARMNELDDRVKALTEEVSEWKRLYTSESESNKSLRSENEALKRQLTKAETKPTPQGRSRSQHGKGSESKQKD